MIAVTVDWINDWTAPWVPLVALAGVAVILLVLGVVEARDADRGLADAVRRENERAARQDAALRRARGL